jgi:anion transporter
MTSHGALVSRVFAAFAAGLAIFLYFAPPPDGVTVAMMRTGAVVALTIGLLATEVVPAVVAVIIFFFVAVVTTVAPREVIFSGFSSGAVWLVFGGLIIGVAMRETGLGARIAGTLLPVFGTGYGRTITGTVVVTVLLAFLVPSSAGRILILLPVIFALADRLGFRNGSPGRAGLTLAVALGSLLPTMAILPANVPNNVLMGAAESVYGIKLTYGSYLLLHFPVIGLIGLAALPVFIVLLFRDTAISDDGAIGESAPVTPREVRLMVILTAALALWLTDTLHGISPAWVSLGAGILCLLPGIGAVPPQAMIEKVNYGPWFFVAGVIGLGAVIAHSGLGPVLAERLLPVLELTPGHDARNFAAVVGLGMGTAVVTTFPGQPALMTAMAGVMAQATGWPLLTVLMAQVPSWALILFPYQAPPLVLALQLSGMRVSEMMRLLLPLVLFGWLVMVPLQYVWWRFLGYFG